MEVVKLILLVLALVCFLLAAVGIGSPRETAPRVNLIAAGLAALTASMLPL